LRRNRRGAFSCRPECIFNEGACDEDGADAPALVQDALKARGKVLKLESVQKDGTTTYAGQVQEESGKKSSVALDAQGKPIKR
jgi:hypothetical protein